MKKPVLTRHRSLIVDPRESQKSHDWGNNQFTCCQCGRRGKPRALPAKFMDSSLANAFFAEDDSLVILDMGPEAICSACEKHGEHHCFDERCALCWLERENARRDAEHIRVFRENGRKERQMPERADQDSEVQLAELAKTLIKTISRGGSHARS
jgi:hypothetical protein